MQNFTNLTGVSGGEKRQNQSGCLRQRNDPRDLILTDATHQEHQLLLLVFGTIAFVDQTAGGDHIAPGNTGTDHRLEKSFVVGECLQESPIELFDAVLLAERGGEPAIATNSTLQPRKFGKSQILGGSIGDQCRQLFVDRREVPFEILRDPRLRLDRHDSRHQPRIVLLSLIHISISEETESRLWSIFVFVDDLPRSATGKHEIEPSSIQLECDIIAPQLFL